MSKHLQKFKSNYSDMYHTYIHVQKNVKITSDLIFVTSFEVLSGKKEA